MVFKKYKNIDYLFPISYKRWKSNIPESNCCTQFFLPSAGTLPSLSFWGTASRTLSASAVTGNGNYRLISPEAQSGSTSGYELPLWTIYGAKLDDGATSCIQPIAGERRVYTCSHCMPFMLRFKPRVSTAEPEYEWQEAFYTIQFRKYDLYSIFKTTFSVLNFANNVISL